MENKNTEVFAKTLDFDDKLVRQWERVNPILIV